MHKYIQHPCFWTMYCGILWHLFLQLNFLTKNGVTRERKPETPSLWFACIYPFPFFLDFWLVRRIPTYITFILPDRYVIPSEGLVFVSSRTYFLIYGCVKNHTEEFVRLVAGLLNNLELLMFCSAQPLISMLWKVGFPYDSCSSFI